MNVHCLAQSAGEIVLKAISRIKNVIFAIAVAFSGPMNNVKEIMDLIPA